MKPLLLYVLATVLAVAAAAQITEGWQSVPELEMPAGGPTQLVPAGNRVFLLMPTPYAGTGVLRGRLFDTATSSWVATPGLTQAFSAPETQTSPSDDIHRFVAVWTGSRLLVRSLSSGGVGPYSGSYDPGSDTWTNPTNLAGGPGIQVGATAVWTGTRMFVYGGGNGVAIGGCYDPATDTWDTRTGLIAGGPTIGAGATAVWTGTQVVVWGSNGSSSTTGGVYDLASDTWLNKPALTNNTAGPNWADGTRAFWTGTRLLIWGDVAHAGIYNPAADSWGSVTNLAGAAAPTSNTDSSKVWTGTHLLVWSGSAANQSGKLFSVSTDSWSSPTNLAAGTGAPTGRIRARVTVANGSVWVFGGIRNAATPAVYENTGGCYDFTGDQWLNIAAWARGLGGPIDMSASQAAVWDGAGWVFWGGMGATGALSNRGARFNRSSNQWEYPTNLTAGTGAPTARSLCGCCWTGSKLLVLGGENASGQVQSAGGLYDPATDTWSTPAGLNPCPTNAVGNQTFVAWTGSRAIVVSKRSSWASFRGGIYDPATDTWENTPNLSAGFGSQVTIDDGVYWTGAYLLAWDDNRLESRLYDPAADEWLSLSALSQIDPLPLSRPVGGLLGESLVAWGGHNARRGFSYNLRSDRYVHRTNLSTGGMSYDAEFGFAGVWTGETGAAATRNRVMAWGGRNTSSQIIATGASYDAAGDLWTALPAGGNRPSARENHSGVWTGTQFLVWGGSNSGYFNNGGVFDPTSFTWVSKPNLFNGAGAPATRSRHSAVWTGQRMIVWGGANTGYHNNGGSYDPAADAWVSTPILTSGTAAPAARTYHRAVWTGSQMIVWGGMDGSVYLDSGGIYNPATDTWLNAPNLASGTGAPAGRSYFSAIWTGDRMFVWGGYSTTTTNDNTGGMYDPATDTWDNLTNLNNGNGAPNGAIYPLLIWDGARVIVLGSDGQATGGIYDPSTDTWTLPAGMTATASAGVPDECVVSAGQGRLFFWGGTVAASWVATGKLLDVENDDWVSASNLNSGTGAPQAAAQGYSTWTGEHYLLWVGVFDTGGAYNPTTDTWESVPNLSGGIGDPPYAQGGVNAWSGTEFVTRGGSVTQMTGGIYQISVPTPTTEPDLAVRRMDGWHVQHSGTDNLIVMVPQGTMHLDYRLLNLGNASLTLGAVNLTNASNCTPAIVASPGTPIAPFGAFELLGIDVTVGGSGGFQFDIEISSNDPDEATFTFTVMGNAPAPVAEIEVEDASANPVPWGSTVSMGNNQAGQPASLSFMILNSGTATLAIGGVSFLNQSNCTAALVTTPAASVAPTGATTLAVEVTPAYAGAFSLIVSIVNSDPNEDPFEFVLSGNGLGQPEINVQVPGGASIPSGGSDTIAGAAQGVGSNVHYDVQNLGTADLLISAVQLLNQSGCTASVTGTPASPMSGPAGSDALDLLVTPSAAGAFSFTLRIINSDPNEGTYTIQVSGTAAAGAPGIAVDRSGTPVSHLGTDTVGSLPPVMGSVIQYDVLSTGTLDLTLGTVIVTGTTNCSVTLLTQPASPVAPTASTLFEVEITPLAAGAFTADLEFPTNVSGMSPFQFSVAGVAPATADLVVLQGTTVIPNGTTVQLGNQPAGSLTSLPFTLSNNGGTDLLLTGTPVVQVVVSNCGLVIVQAPGGTIPSGSSETLELSLTPVQAGMFTCVVTIANNDLGDNPFIFTISGTGTPTSGSGTGGKDEQPGCSVHGHAAHTPLLSVAVLLLVIRMARMARSEKRSVATDLIKQH